jgi:hypothetical protein
MWCIGEIGDVQVDQRHEGDDVPVEFSEQFLRSGCIEALGFDIARGKGGGCLCSMRLFVRHDCTAGKTLKLCSLLYHSKESVYRK